MRRILVAAALALALGVGWVGYRIRDHPSLAPWGTLEPRPVAEGTPRVTFLGVSTLLVSDGTTSLLTDGFFTRPGKLRTLLARIAPDPEIIARSLERAGIRRLDAVIVVHSHYDHSMDAPEVARQTGALVLGSMSTANVARGTGLPEERIRVVTPGEPQRFGDFEVTLIPSRHLPHGMAMGEITEPLAPPARVVDYREGGSYSVLISHPGGSLLVQGSAGWLDRALDGRRADVVFLGIGGLGAMDETYRDAYWRQVVEATAPGCVVPIHWDDFTLPLDQPLRPMPRLLDDFDATMAELRRRAAAAGITLALPPVAQPFGLECGTDRARPSGF